MFAPFHLVIRGGLTSSAEVSIRALQVLLPFRELALQGICSRARYAQWHTGLSEYLVLSVDTWVIESS